MLNQATIFFMVLAFTCLMKVQTSPISSADLDESNKKLSDAFMLERVDIGPRRFIGDHLYADENIDDDEIFHQKRQLKKKWNTLHSRAQSAYTIAFPALIRTRRSIQ